jgi:hypothetical protein
LARINNNNNKEYCGRLQKAVDGSLDNLGKEPKQALLFHLANRYDIVLGGTDCSPLEEIEKALYDMLGEGAKIVTGWIKEEMEAKP